jgi:hypothetical protein
VLNEAGLHAADDGLMRNGGHGYGFYRPPSPSPSRIDFLHVTNKRGRRSFLEAARSSPFWLEAGDHAQLGFCRRRGTVVSSLPEV